MVTDPKQLVGKILNGKYEVQDILGEGGMGIVFKVRHLILKKRNLFALKILHPRFSTDDRFRERFLREVEVAMELTHENIVQIRDFGITEHKLLFFTMDYCAGDSLKEVIRRIGPFPPSRAATIARDLLRALTEAHRAGVVHRDLKPDNILIDTDNGVDRVRILDFGIAKIVEGDGDSHTLTQGGVIGTPKYMSPEQASGEKVDARSDLYSLGVVLYEMLTGQVPFSGSTARSIVMAHITTPPPAFRKIRSDLQVPARLERFVFELLEKDRDQRPASAAECIALLDDTNTLELSECRTTPTARGRRRRMIGSRRSLWLRVAVILMAVLGPAAYFGWQYLEVRSALAEAREESRASTPQGLAAARDAGSGANDEVDDASATSGTSAATPHRPSIGSPSDPTGGIAPAGRTDPSAPDATVSVVIPSARHRSICDVCRTAYAPGQRATGMCCWLPLRSLTEDDE